MKTARCRLCGSDSQAAFRRTLMQTIDVQYYSCPACGYFQTESPHWLERAYEKPINVSDTGLIERNFYFAQFLSLFFISRKRSRFLDFAGGYGILVRLMRNLGYCFYWSDPHCQNIFAAGFEWKRDEAGEKKKFDVVTAFEVLEHAVDPVQLIAEMLESGAERVVFSTQTFRGRMPDPDWWYLGLDHGQHIGFFNERALRVLAKRFQMRLVSFRGLHCFSKRPVSRLWFVFSAVMARFCVLRAATRLSPKRS